LRKIEKTNPNCRGGYLNEKTELGSFANKGDERIKLCHTRFLVDKKQNISFSFDPESMKCFSCGGVGMTSARKGAGGGKAVLFSLRPKLSGCTALQARGMCKDHSD
jgi:hypothetical protein